MLRKSYIVVYMNVAQRPRGIRGRSPATSLLDISERNPLSFCGGWSEIFSLFPDLQKTTSDFYNLCGPSFLRLPILRSFARERWILSTP